MNDFRQLALELCQFGRSQLAFKHAQLQVISPLSHGFEHLTKSFFISDVVSDDEGFSHTSTLFIEFLLRD